MNFNSRFVLALVNETAICNFLWASVSLKYFILLEVSTQGSVPDRLDHFPNCIEYKALWVQSFILEKTG